MHIEKHVLHRWPGDHRLHKYPWWELRVNKISFMHVAQITEWVNPLPFLRLPLGGRRSERDAASPSLGDPYVWHACVRDRCGVVHCYASVSVFWWSDPHIARGAIGDFLCHLASCIFPFSDWSLCSCMSAAASPAQESHLHALCAPPSVLVHLCTCLSSVQSLCGSLSRCDVSLPVADPSSLWRSFCFDQRVQIPRHYSLIFIDNMSVGWGFRSPFIWEKCLYHEWFCLWG